jgi:CRP-like cAMP-binding protein
VLSVYDIIQEHAFFSGMPAYQLQLIIKYASPMQFEAGEIVFRSGTEADRFYLVGPGKILMEMLSPGQGCAPIQIIGEGEVLGWSWLFPPYRWPFDARTLTKTQTVSVNGLYLRNICASDHELGYELTRRFACLIAQRLQAQLLALHNSYTATPSPEPALP